MSTSVNNEDELYTVHQQRVLGYIPLLTAPLSLLGSGLIVYVILLERNKTLKSTYHRMVLGMSTLDFVNSLSIIVFGPWAAPKEASYFVAGAKGTFQTCEVAGFFLNLMFGTMYYSAFLAIYFLLLIGFECREKTIATYFEPFGHAFSWLFPLVTGSIGVSRDIINPLEILPGFCWFEDFPPECSSLDDVPCTRGQLVSNNSIKNASATIASPLFVVIIFGVILFSMAAITLKVRRIERRIQQYASGPSNQLKRTKETSVQALLYIAAFFLTYSPYLLINLFYHDRYEDYYFGLAVLAKILMPCQGFFNFFIYVRKQINRITTEHGSLGFLRRLPMFRSTTQSQTSADTRNGPPENNGPIEQPAMTETSNKPPSPSKRIPSQSASGESETEYDTAGVVP